MFFIADIPSQRSRWDECEDWESVARLDRPQGENQRESRRKQCKGKTFCEKSNFHTLSSSR
jgi:hypothetical protein